MTVIPDLFETQIGIESVWGTPVTPTAKLGLIEECTISPEIAIQYFEEQRGSLAPSYVAKLMKRAAGAKVSGILTYEDSSYWLNSLLGLATPSGANPYVRAHGAPLGTVPARTAMTLVKKQTGGSYGLAGAIVAELTIKAEAGDDSAWRFEATLIGKSIAAMAGASLSDRTQTPIGGIESSLYIDAKAGTIGTTAVAATWFAFELALKSNAALFWGLGSADPRGYREAKWKGSSLKLTAEVAAETTGYLDAVLADVVEKQVRIKATTGASAIQQLDFAGGLNAPELFSDADGVSTLEFEMTPNYNTALANWFKASNTNAVATLP